MLKVLPDDAFHIALVTFQIIIRNVWIPDDILCMDIKDMIIISPILSQQQPSSF